MIFVIVNDGLMMHQIMIIIWMLLLLLVIKKVTNKPTEGEIFIKSHKFAFSGPLASFQDFSCLFASRDHKKSVTERKAIICK